MAEEKIASEILTGFYNNLIWDMGIEYWDKKICNTQCPYLKSNYLL